MGHVWYLSQQSNLIKGRRFLSQEGTIRLLVEVRGGISEGILRHGAICQPRPCPPRTKNRPCLYPVKQARAPRNCSDGRGSRAPKQFRQFQNLTRALGGGAAGCYPAPAPSAQPLKRPNEPTDYKPSINGGYSQRSTTDLGSDAPWWTPRIEV